MSSDSSLSGAGRGSTRVRIFVDFWNLQITMNQKSAELGQANMMFDWSKLPAFLVKKASELLAGTPLTYEGMHVYASYNPRANDEPLKRWMLNWLNRQPGVQVDLRERRPRSAPHCPNCRSEVSTCQSCGGTLRGTQEKGVDTAIVTDMIRLAWEESYDVAILVSSDSDLVPAVEFLDLRGRKVIQAGFPPAGAHLATACWASFDMFAERDQFRR